MARTSSSRPCWHAYINGVAPSSPELADVVSCSSSRGAAGPGAAGAAVAGGAAGPARWRTRPCARWPRWAMAWAGPGAPGLTATCAELMAHPVVPDATGGAAPSFSTSGARLPPPLEQNGARADVRAEGRVN